MDFQFSEQQVLLRDTLSRFAREHYSFEQRRKMIDSSELQSAGHWRQLAELGLLGIPFAEADGGFGGNMIDIMVVMEEFGKALVVEPYLANIVLAGGVLRRVTDDAQRAELLAPLIDGGQMISLAYVEPRGRYDLSEVRTMAEKSDEGYVLNGQKIVVLNGSSADRIIVSARTSGVATDAEGISLFIVDAQAPGLTRNGYPTVDGFRAADIEFDGVKVAKSAVLGPIGQGLSLLEAAIDDAIIAIGAEGVGAMDFLNKTTVEYTKARKQFGVPIANFQVLQHRMVDMFIEREQTVSVLYWAAMVSALGGTETQKATSALKIQLGRATRFVGQQAVQLHGGMGIAEEGAVAHYFKRLSMIGQQFGNADFHASRYASLDALRQRDA